MYLEDRSNPALSLSFRPRQSRSTQGCVTMKIIVTYWKQKKKTSVSVWSVPLRGAPSTRGAQRQDLRAYSVA